MILRQPGYCICWGCTAEPCQICVAMYPPVSQTRSANTSRKSSRGFDRSLVYCPTGSTGGKAATRRGCAHPCLIDQRCLHYVHVPLSVLPGLATASPKHRGHLREELAANLPIRILFGMDVHIPEPPKQRTSQVLRELRGYTAVFRTPDRERDDDGCVHAGRGRGMEVGHRFGGRQSELVIADTEAELARVGVEGHKSDPQRLAGIGGYLLPAGEDGGKGKRLRLHGAGRQGQQQGGSEQSAQRHRGPRRLDRCSPP